MVYTLVLLFVSKGYTCVCLRVLHLHMTDMSDVRLLFLCPYFFTCMMSSYLMQAKAPSQQHL